jgi:hypothetical protein
MANELQIRNTFMAAPQDVDNEFEREMAEQMAGAQMSFPRAKVPSGGLLVFDCGDDNPKTLTGVIVEQHPFNAYWHDRTVVNGSVPDCSSVDGQHGVRSNPNVPGPTGNCQNCPLNLWGSGFGGKGKACSNKVAVYILRDGETVPTELDLPATSIKPFYAYLSFLRQNRKLPSSVVTEISLAKQTTGDNTYSVCRFARVADLAPDAAKEAMNYAHSMRDMVRSNGFVEVEEEDPFNV